MVATELIKLKQATMADEECRFMNNLIKMIKNMMSKSNASLKMVEMLRQELEQISAISTDVKIGYETEYLVLLQRFVWMQATKTA